MSAEILNGRQIATETLEKLRLHIQEAQLQLGLAVILVGDDSASKIYVGRKEKACSTVGIRSFAHYLPQNVSQQELSQLIATLNQDVSVHGILLQLPLPSHLNTPALLDQIHPLKDIDGFHPENVGLLAISRPRLRPCTPFGIMTLLAAYNIELAGKEAVVVGASSIVGRPMALELLAAGCTTTICHRLTQNLKEHVKRAELLVVAAGHPHLIPGEWIKEGAVVVDVGINRLENGSIIGDVEFDSACKRAAYITPVPGGIGPMTVASLIKNTVLAYRLQRGIVESIDSL